MDQARPWCISLYSIAQNSEHGPVKCPGSLEYVVSVCAQKEKEMGNGKHIVVS